ncbi:MAG: extracellular solute-binding protein [Victivallales bacterium]
MNSEQIKRIFGCPDFNSEKPAYRQLEEKLGAFIENAENNTPLPSERDVSSVLKINRRTLRRGMEPFVKSGLIHRGIKGTVVKKQSGLPSNDESHVHPFNFGMTPFFTAGKTMKLMLYENLRSQRDFWNTAVEMFNLENPMTKIVPEWIPLSVATAESYRIHIREKNPDIIQFSLSEPHRELASDIASPLPDDIGGLLSSSSICWKHIFSDGSRRTAFVPLHFAAHAFFCNMDLAEKSKLRNMQKRPPRHSFEQELADISLPSGIKAAGHVEDLYSSLCLGAVPSEYNEKSLEHFFRKRFEHVGRLPANAESWFAGPINEKVYEIYRSMKLFTEGRVMFSGAFSMFIADSANKMGFQYSAFLPHPEKDGRLLTGVGGIAVNSSSENKECAWDFARFMLSEKIQKLFPEKLRNFSILKSCNQALANYFGESMESLDKSISLMKTASLKDYDLGLKLAEARHGFYHKLHRKEITVKDALEITMNKLRKENFL